MLSAALPSFPTRRSSDLYRVRPLGRRRCSRAPMAFEPEVNGVAGAAVAGGTRVECIGRGRGLGVGLWRACHGDQSAGARSEERRVGKGGRVWRWGAGGGG